MGIDFAGHQRYIHLLFWPIFYIHPHPETYSFISTLLLSLGAIPVYLLATDISESKKVGLYFSTLYFIHPSVSWLFLNSVKEEVFALPFLLFAFYFMYKKSFKLFVVFLFMACICKENIPLVAIMFGAYAYLNKLNNKWVITPMILGSSVFCIEIFILQPYFANLSYSLYGHESIGFLIHRYSYLGDSIAEIIYYSLTNPLLILHHLLTWPNLKYLLILFSPFCFISFLRPKVLVIGLPVFMLNLLSNQDVTRQIFWHYVSVPVFVIICSAICSISIITRKSNKNVVNLFMLIIAISSLVSFYTFGAIPETIERINLNTGRVNEINLLTLAFREIPHSSSVLCSSDLGPYFYKHKNLQYHEMLKYYQKAFNDTGDIDYDNIIFTRGYINLLDYNEMNSMLKLEDREMRYVNNVYIFKKSDNDQTDFNIYNRLFFKTQENVGHLTKDDSINKYVFYSNKTQNNSGYLVYGPYITLPKGEYEIEYIIKADCATDAHEKIATIDIFSTYIAKTRVHTTDAQKDLSLNDLIEGEYRSIILNLIIDDYNKNRLIEFRVFQHGVSDLYVYKINVNRI
jgi:uncharacterized membrane protein